MSPQPEEPPPGRQNFDLRGRIERFLTLRSASDVLLPHLSEDQQQPIAAVCRALHRDLKALSGGVAPPDTASDFAKLDTRLSDFEHSIRTIAVAIPLEQIRKIVPQTVEDNRRGVLDVLDLMLSPELGSFDKSGSHIGTIDFLITLLCTTAPGSNVAFLHDPVTLTPRLYGLCAQSDVDYDARLPEIEAEFFRAAAGGDTEADWEEQLLILARRKIELGAAYFAPGVLRAIVSYNASLFRKHADRLMVTACSEPRNEHESGDPSVFETPILAELAAALRRREAREPQQLSPVDRVTWALDLAYATQAERERLTHESVATSEDLEGTAILIGLLSRSSNVLEEELEVLGISAHRLSHVWVPELDALFKQRTKQLLGDDYQRACALSDVKNKFLFAPMIEVNRENRGSPPARRVVQDGGEARRNAREITREALAAGAEKARRARAGGLRNWPWAKLARISGAVVAVLICAAIVFQNQLPGADLEHYSRDALLDLSPHLKTGRRNGQGSGRAFVGSLYEDSWSLLDPADQRDAADQIVERLRTLGVSQVMIYSEAKQLRIQALGSKPAKIIAAAPAPP